MIQPFPRRLPFACALLLGMFGMVSALGQPPGSDVIAVLKGHTDTVDAVAISPNGKLIATGSFDKTVKLWDAATGKELRTYGGDQGHKGQVLGVAFSPKGDQLATCGTDNTAKVWDVPVNFPVETIATTGAATRVTVSNDGKTFAVAGADGIIKVFPKGEAKGALELKGHVGAVVGLAYSGNGQVLVSAGADRTLRFWNPSNGKPTGSSITGTADITDLGVNSNGSTAFTATADGALKFWQMPQSAGPKEPPAAKTAIATLYVSADGATAIYATTDKTATLFGTSNGKSAGSYTGAKSAIEAITLSANQQAVAAGCADGSLIVWDRQGKVKAEVPAAHTGGVTAVAFPTQSILLTAGSDGLVKGWTFPIEEKKDPKKDPKKDSKPTKYVIKAHAGKVNDAVVHPSNGQLITAGADKLVRIWDPAKPEKALREIGPLAAPVTALTLSRDGQLIAGTAGKDVFLWTFADGKPAGKITQPADVLSLSLSADKTRALLGRSDNLAVLVDVATGIVLQAFSHGGPVRGVFAHPSQPLAITTSADKTVLVTPITATRAIVLGTAKPAGLVVSPGGERVIAVGPGKEAVSYNTGNGTKERSFEAGGNAVAAAITKNGQWIAVGGSDGSVKVYTIGDGKLIGSIAAGAPVVDLTFHPSAPQLAGVLNTKAAAVWNVAYTAGQPLPPEFGQPLQSFPLPSATPGLAFLADGDLLVPGTDKQVRRFRIASEKPVKNFSHPNLVDCVAFDETGTLLATGCHDGNLRIFDLQKNAQQKQITAHVQTTPQQVQNPIYCVAWAPGSKQLLTTSYDRSIKLWDVASGKLVKEFKPAPDPKPGDKVEPQKEPVGHRDQVFAAVFSKDGKRFATTSSDRSVKLWDAAAGKVIRDFPNPDLKSGFPGEPAPSHPGWVHAVRFTPDEKFLVTAGAAPRYKGYIAVWSTADGKRVSGTERDFGPIQALVLSPDGTKLVIGCGHRSRIESDAEVVILKMPGK